MLDEIGEMPLALQAKILHVLQDREFTKLGSNRTVEVDVRVIAATNRDLEQMMRQGTFREDLYYRLQVIEVHIPPLRERREEIAQLIEFFLLKFASVYHRPAVRPSLVLQEALLVVRVARQHPRAREHDEAPRRAAGRNADPRRARPPAHRSRQRRSASSAERVAARRRSPMPHVASRCRGPVCRRCRPPPAFAMPAPPAAAPADGIARRDGRRRRESAGAGAHAAMGAEKEAIQHALERFRWNRRKTAEYLQVSYKTLLNKMKECGISESPSASARRPRMRKLRLPSPLTAVGDFPKQALGIERLR